MTQSLPILNEKKNMKLHIHNHVRAYSWHTDVHIYTYIQTYIIINTG